MTVYIVATYDIVDAKAYEPYVPGVLPLLKKHGAEIVVADYDSTPLEGEKRSACAVIKFPSEEAALSWYNDPAYGPVRKVRLNSCANNSLILAKQFPPPSA